ncbi:hypothetical protein MTTB_09560 [Methanothermobacter tenebrarum]|jgi:hypothetical protein|uniref:CARDB domain-containing protein n=1 Tax=Methanothermobacter tenebrarum TaxID=680118 RepID=A0ABM7YDT5_9EURY|nr:CARDB domain-containing protein [Methanothermobacter tenebrarum]MDD3454215.1 CARDB domain-containing protein [Methanobacteriales archaeon]MDI6881301.1 CARDB domain-containing protein [Methanothermobacter sp.]MDX9693165.1 CARDB domain-containing protein [Methanothermobacter sp.]BDH79577.1 hypothetical protein MTTB_09560 [Methanothermobacter tenebrarum]HOQ20732.1 CARDB domain-containing protein [Methanothermobacter sp.]
MSARLEEILLKTSTLIIILIIAALIGVVGAVYLLQGEETTPSMVVNITEKKPSNLTSTRGGAELVAVQEGPKTAHPGTNVTITCKIKNIGSEAAENITITSQIVERHIDRIGPGEEVEFTVKAYIPTPEEVEEAFGPNATLSNPFFIGGYTVIYHDMKGKHEISSNPLRINLI